MNHIQVLGWVDTWGLASALYAKYRDRIQPLDPLDLTTDTFVVDETVRKEWRSLRAFLVKLKAEAQLRLGYTPIIGPIAVRRHNPGYCTPWTSDAADVVRVHTCLVAAPLCAVYAGGDTAILAQGVATWVDHRVQHCWANFGEHPMIELTVELRRPPVDAED